MKFTKFKNVFLSALIIFAMSFAYIFTTNTNNENNHQVFASYSTSDSYNSSSENSQTNNISIIEEGQIPFSLFTSTKEGDNNFKIVNYYPTFVESVSSDKTYNYIMEESSAPFILLSSTTSQEVLTSLYNTNIYFKFNDMSYYEDGTQSAYSKLVNLSPNLTLETTNSQQEIKLNTTLDMIESSDNNSYTFVLNLQSLLLGDNSVNTSAHCPIVKNDGTSSDIGGADENYLGGNGNENDVSFRTGFYTFTIEYNYQVGSYISERCIFQMSFYVIDYSNYLTTQLPLNIQNADIYTDNNNEGKICEEYSFYNYNYQDAPYITYDASKFALNFTFENNNNIYNFNYKNFVLEEKNGHTGIVTLNCPQLNKDYSFYTYNVNGIKYLANFDLQNFENNFILPNSDALKTSVFQGVYSFDLDILTASKSSSYIQVKKDLFADEVRDNLSYQNLIIFGYDLRYQDTTPTSPTYQKDVSLRNDYTDNNIYSYNSITKDNQIDGNNNNGKYYYIPDSIPTTNLAPLRFHSFGNLTGTANTASYVLLDVATTSEQDLIEQFKSFTMEEGPNGNEFDELIKNNQPGVYTQSASITSNGIYLMKLFYRAQITMSYLDVNNELLSKKVTITGCQYIFFKINNTIENLLIQSIDADGNTIYDFNDYTNKDVVVSIEQKNNLFSAPFTVSYKYSPDYSTTNFTLSGNLRLKQNSDGSLATRVINGKTYNYYVLSNAQNNTFSSNGYYEVTISRSNTSFLKYLFRIDKSSFSDIKVNQVVSNNGVYVKSNEVSAIQSISSPMPITFYITNTAFTLGWQTKSSNAKDYLYACYMELYKNNESYNLFKKDSTDYLLTNSYEFNNVIKNEQASYENSYNLTQLTSSNYFKNQGLYFFYLYDQAGNYTTIIVLVDNTTPAIAQGNWEGNAEESKWIEDFDPINNPMNYVNKDTTLYFGTHKALKLPNLDISETISFEDKSYKQGYDLTNFGSIIAKQPITFDFYEDILKSFDNYVYKNTSNNLFTQTSDNNYYLILPNQPYELLKPFSKTNSTVIPYDTIYLLGSDEFSGEKDYVFSLTNINGNSTIREISMNTDNIKGSFSAYNNSNETHSFKNNSATNLNILKFEYEKVSGELASFYEVKSLTYEYYPFVLDENDPNYSVSTYPFASTPTISNENLILTNVDGNTYSFDRINIGYKENSTIEVTKPGKYIVTRVYNGGTHNFVNGEYVEAEGGDYYFDGENYIYLFELDPKVRTYVIYVDQNGIISSSSSSLTVGDNISLSLNYQNQNNWTFKDFINNINLDTNEVPVKINIPFSKYFKYDSKQSLGYLFCDLDFALLNITIKYTDKNNQLFTYVIDGYNTQTGLSTCSSLVSTSNPNGDLIFDREGSYQIIITDNCGYSLIDSNNNYIQNYNPTSFTYSFTITYSSPSVEVYTNTYNENSSTLIESKLSSIGDNSYATNIELNSSSSTNNQLYLKWDDPRTPYLSKVSLIEVEVEENGVLNTYQFSLTNDSLKNLADNNLCLVYDKTNKTLSAINKDVAENSNFLLYLYVKYYNQVNPSENFDGVNYYRYSYSLHFSLEEEYKYNVKLTYGTNFNDSYDFKQVSYSINVDRTKPNTNIDNLINNEDFLKTYYPNAINSFKEENFDSTNLETLPSSLTYTFGVSENYSLIYDPDETVSYFYIRKYSKYNGEYPSITPDMVNSSLYQNSSLFARYPKFSEISLNNGVISIGSSTYYQVQYSQQNKTLYSIITSLYGANTTGYFEIIEKDNAENYRSFTVYFGQGSTNNYQILSLDGQDSENLTFKPTTDNNLTATSYFNLTELYSVLGWGAVTIKNETINSTFSQTIMLSPFNKKLSNDLLSKINSFLTTQLNSKYSFTLSKYNLSYPSILRAVNIITNVESAKLDMPEIIEVTDIQTNTTTYNLVLPAYSKTTTLYLTSLTLRKYSSENKQWQQVVNYTTKEEVANNNPIKSLSKGIYQVIYTDNYNLNSYSYNLYVGEFRINDFNVEYQFENNYLNQSNNVYYTGGDIQVTYEGNIYKVEVNGVLYSGTSYEQTSTSLANQNCKTFTLTSNYSYDNIPANQVVGGNTRYVVKYYDITDNSLQKEFVFNIFNTLPEIKLLNNDNLSDEIASSLEESSSHITNSRVLIDWGYITTCDYDKLNDSTSNQVSVATLYQKDSKGQYSIATSVERGYVVNQEGYYKLEIKNAHLGCSRSIYFVIQFGEIPIYTVSVNNETISASKYEQFNLTSNSSSNQAYFKGSTSPSSLINVIYQALTDLYNKGYLQNLNNSITDYENLIDILGFESGSFNLQDVDTVDLINVKHFYSIYTPEIIYNNNVDLSVVEFCFKNNSLQDYYVQGGLITNPTPENVEDSYWTTIYLLYNLEGPIRVEFFAFTKVPKTSTLLSQSLYYNTDKVINLSGQTAVEKILTNKDLDSDTFTLSWDMIYKSSQSSYWYNQGNYIYVLDQYGVDNEFVILENSCDLTSKKMSATISNSGTHKLMFKDIAGNTHRFSSSSTSLEPNVFNLYVLLRVIYNISYNNVNYNPIQYGVFNDSLKIVIDPSYISKNLYTMSNVEISVSLNGKISNSYTKVDNTYEFTSPGKYVVTLKCLYNGEYLENAIYNFIIISTKSARLAFEYSEVKGYEIIQVIKDSQDITSNFMKNGKVTSINIGATDSNSGSGSYTIKLKYGNRDSDVLTFSFLISDYVPTISCNVEYGGTTKSNIVISYNSSYIFQQLGECYINILTYNSDSDTFYVYGKVDINENNLSTNNTLTLEESNSYFIELKTSNGDTVTSFRVNKVDPLNAFAIIAIVIGSIAFIVLLIIIIKLRTRMRVR